MPLSNRRKSLSPHDGDNWQSIASRELSGIAIDEAIGQLQSWNIHIFMRSKASSGSAKEHNPILPCDVIFLEPPLAHH